jgi:hypothetical protein
MSYCRFENTANDLRDCLDHPGDADLSQSEKNARETLLALCRDVIENADEETEEGTE